MIMYRSDIDGLRAIAILSVVAFHISPFHLYSGFVGVDIFFVISGYLITSTILQEIQEDSFRLLSFYYRRILRLFPALILVVFIVIASGWFLLFPDEFISLGKHVTSASFFISNFILARETDYFSLGAESKPLLHLWSLAIEEQYYLIFPAVMLVLKKNARILCVTIGGLIVLSFGAGFLVSQTERFYFPQFRIWEILLGAGLANFPVNQSDTKKNCFSLIGLCLLMFAFGLIKRASPFPGWLALLPTLGTCLIIAGGPAAFINKRLLSNPALTFIGKISYPLYLWHWPVMSYSYILSGGIVSLRTAIFGAIMSFLLAVATYLLIEKPIKRLSDVMKIKFSIILLITLVLFGTLGFFIYKNIIPAKPFSPQTEIILKAVGDWQSPQNEKQIFYKGLATYEVGSSDRKVLFYGDSHITQLFSRIDYYIQENKTAKSAIFIAHGACAPIPGFYRIPKDELCQASHEYASLRGIDPDIDAIVLGASWLSYFNNYSVFYHNGHALAPNSTGSKSALAALKKNIQYFNQHHKKVYLILGTPHGSAYDPRNMIKRDLSPQFSVIRTKFNKSDFFQQYGTFLDDLRRIEGVTLIDPFNIICDKEECSTTTEDGRPIYSDFSHVRPYYIKEKFLFLDELLKP